MLDFFSGSSSAVNTKSAVRECVDNAFGAGGGSECSLLIIHTTMGHNFAHMAAAAREVCPEAEIVGCSATGIIGREGVNEAMRAMAMMAVTGDEVAVAVVDGLTGANSAELGEEAARQLRQGKDGINIIYVLTAGLDLAGDRVIEGIERVFGPEVPIFGATSADHGKAKGTFQFHGDKVFEQSIVLVGFADPSLEVIMGVHHGSVPLEGNTFEVTRSEDNRIFELDGEPAWPRLMSRLGLPAETEPAEVVPISGLGIELGPEDQEEYDNPQILRVPIKVSDDHQSFYLPTTCPTGTRVVLMQRDEQYIFAGVDRLMDKMVGQLNGRRPLAVFHADCMARGRRMFNRVLKDEIIAKLQYPLSGDEVVPWLGIYGFSEYCRFGGKNQFHSYTSALCPIVRREDA